MKIKVILKTILNDIKGFFNLFIGKIADILSGIKGYRMIGLVIVMFLFCLAIFMIMSGGVKDAIKQVAESRAKRTEDYVTQKHNRYITDRINLKVFRILDEIYKYSRHYTKQRHLSVINSTSWNYFVITNITAILFGSIALLLISPGYGILMFIVVFVLRYGYLQFLRMKITRQIEDEIVLFLNLLSSYSTGNTEIISTFAVIAHKMKPALRDCLIECVAESQGKGGAVFALENLARKVESRKFKEVIKNLEISQRFSGSFHLTAMALRKDALEYVNEKHKLTELIVQNSITLAVIVGSVVACLPMMGKLIDADIWELFTEPVGLICVGGLIAVITWLALELMKINKA